MAKDIKAARTLADTGLCGYICTMGADRCEVYASSSYEAQTKAVAILGIKPKQQYRITSHLCERVDGTAVLQSATF